MPAAPEYGTLPMCGECARWEPSRPNDRARSNVGRCAWTRADTMPWDRCAAFVPAPDPAPVGRPAPAPRQLELL